MAKKIAFVVIVLGLIASFIWHPFSHTQAKGNNSAGASATPSIAPPTDDWTTASPLPTTNYTVAAELTAGLHNLKTATPLEVTFNGSDAGGQLAFDVITDGNGHLSGTYTRSGKTGQVVVSGGTLYMRGADVLSDYTGEPVDPSVTGWVQVPSDFSISVLGTVASSSMMITCFEQMQYGWDGWRQTGTQPVAGNNDPALSPITDTPTPWLFTIHGGQQHPLVSAVDFVVFQPLETPAECNGGTIGLQGNLAGPSGEFTFAPSPGGAGPAGVPSPVQPMPTLAITKDPGLPTQPSH